MIAVHEVGTILLLPLGMAFLLIWVRARDNQTAGYWAASHFALALAAIAGYRFQAHGAAIPALVSLLGTGCFLAMMCAANLSMTGVRVSIGRVLVAGLLISMVVGLVGFGVDQFAGRVLVVTLMIGFFVWSGYIFWTRFNLRVVAIAFFVKGAALMLWYTQGQQLATTDHSTLLSAINWTATILLALVLVDVASRLLNTRLTQMLQHIPEAIVACRKDGTILLCNHRFAELVGATSPERLVGKALASLPLVVTGSPGNAILSPFSDEERQVEGANGRRFTAEITSATFIEFGSAIIVTHIRDITERERIEAERLRMLSTDTLTGLANRQGLERQLQQVLLADRSEQRSCAVIAIDIQRFKRINDAFGVQRGDAVLRQLGAGLEQLMKPGDLVARIGGNEFMIALANLPGDSARPAAVRNAQAIQHFTQHLERGGDIAITLQACIGIAISDDSSHRPDVLISEALLALNEAKSTGSGDFMFYRQHMDERIRQALHIEAGLRRALTDNELTLHYQPIVDSGSGAVVKVEALLRWHSATQGQVPPGVFIPVAEQSNLIIEMGRWVLNEACRQAAEWIRVDARAPVISVNISARQFISSDFESTLLGLIDHYRIPASALELELTESLFIDQDSDEVLNLLQRLADRGFSLSLDDFGTGYSSLAYLTRFPLSTVKIDRSFVTNMEHDKRKRPLVRTIINMGHNLGLKVVAEGVETDAQRLCLMEDGCDLLQGYLLGRPQPAATVSLAGPVPQV